MITGFFDDGFGLGVPERITISAGDHSCSMKKIKTQKTKKEVDGVKIKNDNGYVFIGNSISPFDVLALKTKLLKQK